MTTTPLVGKFFHTTTTCPNGHPNAVWQGHIIAAPGPDLLLIETFEWLTGEPYGQVFITLADFAVKNPVLYSNDEEMRFSYTHGRMRGCECEDAS